MSPTSSAPGPQERFDLDANDESLPLLQALMRRHGNTFAVPSLTRAGDGLVINDPDDIRRVLLTNRVHPSRHGPLDIQTLRRAVGNTLLAGRE